MNLIDCDKLLEHLGERHTGHVMDYRLSMAIEAAKVDILPIIQGEIAEALCNISNRHIAKREPMHETIRMIAKELDPPSAETKNVNPCPTCGLPPEVLDGPLGPTARCPRCNKPGMGARHLIDSWNECMAPSAEPVAQKLNPCIYIGRQPSVDRGTRVECVCHCHEGTGFTHDEWNASNPIKPEPPACMACLDTGKCEIFCKCGAGTRAKNAEMVR